MDDSDQRKEFPAAQRKYLRLSAMGPVDISIKGGKPQVGYLASISHGGVGIYLHQKVEANQLVILGLRAVGENPGEEELKIVARVCWGKPAGELFMAGLSFEKMSERRHRLLLNHLKMIEQLQLVEGLKLTIDPPKTKFTIRE